MYLVADWPLKPEATMDLGLLVRLVNIVKLTNSTSEETLNSTEIEDDGSTYPDTEHLDCTRLYQFIFSVVRCCYDGTQQHGDKDH